MCRLIAAIFIGLLLGNAADAQSTTWLDVALDSQGRATEAVVVSDTHPVLASSKVFEREALWAVKKWRFQPETIEGRPVSTEVVRTVEFNLD